MRIIFILLSIFLVACASTSNQYPKTIEGALKAERDGNSKEAIDIFTSYSAQGDSKASIHLGMKYHNGSGVSQDYTKALNWYLIALKQQNYDSLNNIGVIFREGGNGIQKNRKIAYILFLVTHMASLGDHGTQIRANKNLRREIAVLSQSEKQEALCYTWSYVKAYIHSHGTLQVIPSEVLPSPGDVSFKNNPWWTPEEKVQMSFSCQAPWA